MSEITEPLGIGGILLQGLRLLVRRLYVILSVGVLTAIMMGGLSWGLFLVAESTEINNYLLAAIGLILYILGSTYLYAFMIRLVTLDLRGVKVGLGEVLKSLSRATVLKLFGTGFLVFFAIFLIMVLLAIPGILLGIDLLIAAAAIVGMVLVIYLLLAPAAVVEENLGYRAAMIRSFQLVWGYWWYMLGALLVTALAIQVLLQIVARLIGFILIAMGFDAETGPATGYLIVFLLLSPVQLLIPPILYHQIRVRKGEANLKKGILIEI